ncbi:MAG: DUF5723 family protein [Rikenellaceae bacterium]
MKRLQYIIATLLAVATTVSTATAKDVNSFFMPNAIDRLDLNAALTIDRGYVSIPIIGGTSFSTNGNIALGDIFYPVDDSLVPLTDPSVSSSTALGNLNSDSNRMSLGLNTTIFSIGKWTKRDWFWNFDVSLKSTTSINMPYSLAEFIRKAPEQTTINDLSIYMDSYSEMAFGLSIPVNDKLRVGGRVKALIGLASAEINIDELTITANDELWEAKGSGSIDINMSGVESTSGSSTFELGDIDFETPNSIAGWGVGVDLGATYQLLDKLELSASVNNLGFMRWSSKNNLHGDLSSSFSFSGFGVDVDGEDVETNYDDNLLDLEEMLLFDETESSDNTYMLQADFNLGAQYSLWRGRASAGILYSAEFIRTFTQHSITAGGSITPIKCLSLSAAYTINAQSTNSLGLAINFCIPGLNIYVATNLLGAELTPQYIPIDKSSADVSFGLSIALASRKNKQNKAERKSAM